MKSLISKQVERFLREQKNYKRWLAVFLCLAVVVTIGTAAALKYKGIAVTTDNEEVEVHMEDASASGDTETAHVHTDACYEEKKVLICEAGKAEQGHVHDDSCYSVSGGTEELTCDKEEHSHDDSCYTTETVSETVSHVEKDEEGNETTVEETVEHEEKKLTCDKEEHTHGSDCYSVSGGEKTLTCGLEEGEGAAVSDHVHDDSCYEIQKVLICGLEEGEEEPEEEVVVPEEFKEGTLTAKGDDYEVIVSYGAEAEIPENAELKVEEIEKESDTYKEYYKQMIEALPADEDGREMEVTFARLFDITILVDGKEIEPNPDAKVAVQISYDDVITEDEEQTGYAVHFPDNGEIEVMDADVKDGKEFGFNQSSFSLSMTLFAMPRDGEVDTARVVTIKLEKDKYDGYEAVSIQPGETIKLRFVTEDGSECKAILFTQNADINVGIENGEVKVICPAGTMIGRREDACHIVCGDGYEAHISIDVVNDIASTYEIVYEGFEFETDELTKIEYGNTRNEENHFTATEMSEGSVSDAGDGGSGVNFPYTTWPLEYKLAKDKNSNNYRYFALKGWRTTNGETIEDGTILSGKAGDYSESKEGDDSVKVIRLTPVWEEVTQEKTTILLPTVKFFIALNSEIQETDETQDVPDTALFTTAVAETTTNGIYEQVNVGDQGTKYVPAVYKDTQGGQRRVLVAGDGDKLQVTAGIDTQIRSLATTGVEVIGNGGTWTYRLASFPADEDVLKKIRDGAGINGSISVGGSYVKAEDITTDNFAVRWCVFKHDITDQWHVDGVLVRKQGKLAVTKTFYGEEEAILAVKDKFNITVKDEKGDIAYTLKLHDKQENDSDTDWGYTEEIKNGSEVTYVWEIGVAASKTFTVDENKYESNDESIATVAEYRISNTKIDSTGTETEEGRWNNYTTGQGVKVKAESYASDLSYESFQTVNFKNGYLPKNSITVWKYDGASNKGLAGVVFELKKDGKVQTVWKKGNDYYLYNPGKEEFTTTEKLAVDESGLFVIHGLEREETYGTYTLTEITYPTGYAQKTVTFTIKNGSVELGNSVSSGVTFTPVEGKNAYKLNISNESDRMKIKAVKDWGTTNSKDIKTVKVELWRDGEKLEEAIELNAENGWNTIFEKPYPVYVNGEKGNYTLRETAIGETYRDPGADADGYRFYDVVVDPINISEENGTKTGTITVHNTVDGRKLEFTKTDESGKGLSGAKFTLYTDESCSEDPKEAISSSNGKVTFIGLTSDVYYMKETEAPNGYVASDQVYKVTFDGKDGKIELYSSGAENGASGDGEQAEPGAITTIPNKAATQTIDIIKKDADGKISLQGAGFKLTANTLVAEGSYSSEGNSYVSDESGTVVSGLKLPYGTYTLTETNAPENYNKADPITLTVGADGVTATGTKGDFEITRPSGESASYTITVKDRLGMLSGITLTKIGDQKSETRLNGAIFILGKDSDDGPRKYAMIEGGIIKDWVEEARATPIETKKVDDKEGIGILPTLPVGEYYLKEVTPPKDYVLMTDDVKFEVGLVGGTLGVAIRDGGAKIDENNSLNIFISNSRGIELPEAGGPGTVVYTFGGLAVIAVGLMYGLSMRRKREKGGLN